MEGGACPLARPKPNPSRSCAAPPAPLSDLDTEILGVGVVEIDVVAVPEAEALDGALRRIRLERLDMLSSVEDAVLESGRGMAGAEGLMIDKENQ